MHQPWQEFLQTQRRLFREPLALEDENCIMPLTHLGLLSFTGKEAKSFLQGQVTCNLDEISSLKSSLGAHCNLQGRMQSLFRILALDPHETHYGLILPQAMLEVAKQNFQKYALFSKIQMEVLTTHVGIGLYGPKIASLVTELTRDNLENDFDCVNKKTKYGTYMLSRLNGENPRFEIWADVSVIKPLWELFASVCQLVTSSAWDLLDVRAGIPAIYPATANQILPHHANLDLLHGISFNKGCYLGQEIIARMQYRGKIKKHLYGAYVSNHDNQIKPCPGMGLVIANANEAVGMVLQAAENPQGNFEILVVLDDQYSQFDNLRLDSLEGPPVLRAT